jgi:DNA invertase Pin-like site-specific DNA recombinase
MKVLRCAVYTRKSTEDGLEQQFNSLDAQREACEAYILSQRHEGWTLVPGRYDDGGFSGGNMERPGLRALLDLVDAGQVDVIVVYKVDRLTRSLADFAKIVERLDAKQASFVSITQAFNTTTSMGRLTLNVLLSFAQFEREVTGERIRDKIASSKKKGIWMGGPVPLGYQVIERKLIPVPDEAERVRTIMQRYLEIRSVPALIEALRAEGVVTKLQLRTGSPHRGGIPFARGSLFHLLKNPIYIGKLVHKGKVHEGEHEAIVDPDLFEQVQMHLAEKAPPRKRPTNDRNQALLVGLLADQHGRQIVPTYAAKGTRRYSYYETRKDLARPADPPSSRWSQGLLDRHVLHHLGKLLGDEHGLRHVANLDGAEQLRTMFASARILGERLVQLNDVQAAVRSLVAMIKVEESGLELTLKPAALGLADQPCWRWTIPLPARKPFREAKLRIDGGDPNLKFDQQLVELISQAAQVQDLVLASTQPTINQIANRQGRCRKQMHQLLRLFWLSPRIVDTIMTGAQPDLLTRRRLLEVELPIESDEQEDLFGLPHRTAA